MATVSIFRMTNAFTPLATPMPPSSSATSPITPRKSRSWSIASVRLNSVCAGGAIAHLRRVEPRPEAEDEALRRKRRRELEHRLVLDAAAEQQQRRLVEVLARGCRRADRSPTVTATSPGTLDERADDDEAREAEGQRVADVRIERDEQRRIDEREAALLQAAPLLRRRRDDLAVERIAPASRRGSARGASAPVRCSSAIDAKVETCASPTPSRFSESSAR